MACSYPPPFPPLPTSCRNGNRCVNGFGADSDSDSVRIAPTTLRALLSASAPRPSRSAIHIVPIAPRAPSASLPSHAARVPAPRPRTSRRQSRASTAPIAPPAFPSVSRPPHAARVPVPRVAAATGPWLARIAPHASLSRRMREKGPLPGNICAKCMLLEIKMARSSPYASISGRNRAIQDAWRANLAIKAPFSRRGPGNHAWREDVTSAARPFAAPRRGSRARELTERALRLAAQAWSACRMRGPLPSRPRAPRLHACQAAVAIRTPASCPSMPLLTRPRSSPPLYRRRAPPPVLPVARASCAPPAFLAHRARRADSAAPPQTSGTVQPTQCGHKNGIPERGSH